MIPRVWSDAGPRAPQPTATAVATATRAPTATPQPSAADLFPACERAVGTADWASAADACERVQAQDASYPGITSALASTYVALGKEQVASGGPLSAAVDYFDKALAVRPGDPEAEEQRQWATAYLEGDAALGEENWPEAARKFALVAAGAPAYRAGAAEGDVQGKLFAVRLAWGQALLRDGAYAEAQRRCEQALEVQRESAAAATCRAQALAALATPTPLPTPSLTAAPTAPEPRPATTAPIAPRPATPAPAGPRPTASAPAPQPEPAPPTRAPVVPPTRPPISVLQ